MDSQGAKKTIMAGLSTMMRELIWVFVGGGVGASLRVLFVAAMDRRFSDQLAHIGVLAANMVGCLLIGFLAAALPQGTLRSGLIGGLVGGFTTYSAFALLKVGLLVDGRWGAFAAQLCVHLAGGIIAVGIGTLLGRNIT